MATTIVDLTPMEPHLAFLRIPLHRTIHWTNTKFDTHPTMEISFVGSSPTGSQTDFIGNERVEIPVTHVGDFVYTITYSGGTAGPVTSGPFAAHTCRNCG